MKLMKHITIALVLCAIPAMAFGQATVTCTDCTHAVSVYKGSGGLIATADGVDKVSYVATCGGVTRSDTLTADKNGTVSMLLTGDTACDAEGGGTFELGPIKDGGWYWVTEDMNSAVGNLVDLEILKNAKVELTGAGDGVMMSMGRGAVFVKETSTGRVGILPNILPEPPMPALGKCGFSGTKASDYKRVSSECAMGDGGTITLATWENTNSGTTSRIHDKGTVRRPGGTATLTVTVDLWGNGSGHFVTDPAADELGILLGQPVVAMSAARGDTRLTDVTYTAKLGSGVHGTDIEAGTPVAGITMDTSTSPNLVTFEIMADDDYCSAKTNEMAPVTVTAVISTTGAALVTPAIKRTAAGVAGSTSFTVLCPAAASQGQELVPENPFPTDR